MPSTVGQAVWWRQAGLSASQGQPSPVGLIPAQEQEQRATLELLRVLQVLRARKSPARVWSVLRVDQQVRLVRVSLLPALCTQERPERVLVFGKPLPEASTIPRSE